MSRPANPKVHEPQRRGAFHSVEPVSSRQEVAPVGIEGLTGAGTCPAQKTPPERGFPVSRRPDSNRGPLRNGDDLGEQRLGFCECRFVAHLLEEFARLPEGLSPLCFADGEQAAPLAEERVCAFWHV